MKPFSSFASNYKISDDSGNSWGGNGRTRRKLKKLGNRALRRTHRVNTRLVQG